MSSKALNLASKSGSSENIYNKSLSKSANFLKNDKIDKKQNEPILNAANKAITNFMNNIESSFDDLKKKNKKTWSSVSDMWLL